MLAPGSDGSTITGLAIVDGDHGITIDRSNCNIIRGCRIGTDWSDAANRGNNIGIWLAWERQQIGGSDPAWRNIISGNLTDGIYIQNSTNPIVCNIQGNYIGLNSAGTAALGNQNGIQASNAVGILIGGNFNSEGNVISGNTQYGIYFDSLSCMGNTIAGNVVGMNPTALATIPNQVDGIHFTNGPWGNNIGLPQANYHNVITGNTDCNIYLGSICTSNYIQNNYIGVNYQSTAGFGSNIGVYLDGATKTMVGGNRAILERNVISGNNLNTGSAGVYLASANSNSILGNFIGTNDTATDSRPNYDGVFVKGTSSFNNIGGSNANGVLLGNIISGNGGYGINMQSGSQNQIKGNWIGLDGTGVAPIPNAQYGIHLAGTLHIVGNPTFAAERNVISGNGNYGINLNGTSCQILGNYVGINAGGNTAVDNGNHTSLLCYANYNLIENNYFSNTLAFTNTAFGNTATGNYIGVLPNGNPTGLTVYQGVLFSSGASGNFVGLAKTGKGNLISNISGNGVEINGAGCINDGVFANTITAVGGSPIGLVGGGNNGYPAPVITFAVVGKNVYGTSNPGDLIEVFEAEDISGSGGSVRFLGYNTADVTGHWNVYTPGLSYGRFICASATNASNNTSEYSTKAMAVQPTHTPTVSPTPSRTPTRTATITPTITPTSNNPLIPFDLKGKTTLAFPNPGKRTITFLFHFYETTQTRIEIYNIVGERVAILSQTFPLGQGQTLVWNCQNIAPGVYYANVYLDGAEKQRVRLAVVH